MNDVVIMQLAAFELLIKFPPTPQVAQAPPDDSTLKIHFFSSFQKVFSSHKFVYELI